jgi:hypothetical protein
LFGVIFALLYSPRGEVERCEVRVSRKDFSKWASDGKDVCGL